MAKPGAEGERRLILTRRACSIGSAKRFVLALTVATGFIPTLAASCEDGLARAVVPAENQARPRTPEERARRERELRAVVAAGTATKETYFELARLANARNSYDDTIAALRQGAALEPWEWHRIAAVSRDYALRNQDASPDVRLRYIREGLAAEERVLATDAESYKALAGKLALMEMEAGLAKDPADASRRADIDRLHSQVADMRRTSPDPMILPPPFGGYPESFAQTAARLHPRPVGAGLPVPPKTRDTHYYYADDGLALSENIQGVVILEIIIDPAGDVANARIRRSIPPLDAAALATISEWRFKPTQLNGVPVSVSMPVSLVYLPRQ